MGLWLGREPAVMSLWGFHIVQRTEEGPSTILSLDSSQAMTKGDSKLELFELGKIDRVTFLMLCVLQYKLHASHYFF